MKITAELCVIPIGAGISISSYIAACNGVLRDAGFQTEVNPFGTTVEGEWDAVFAAFKRCHEEIHRLGAQRVFTSIKVGSRTDRVQSNAEKVESVRHRLS